MNCQSMQEMLAPESTSAEGLMTFNVCEGMISCTGIHIDLFDVDTSTGLLITKERELCVEVSLPSKHPFPAQRTSRLLLHHCLQSP